MKSVLEQLKDRMAHALCTVGLEGGSTIQPSQDERHADYQSNCAMSLARQAGSSPREVAERIVEALDVADLCDPVEVAGPGFINLRLRREFIAKTLGNIPRADEPGGQRLGLDTAARPCIVVVDFSSPNLAKEMHVGHLRSTVIGDCVSRILEFMGCTVHRENHVGDWGTQFGMLLAHLRRVHPDVLQHPDKLVIGDLEAFYVDAKKRFDSDEPFKAESRDAVVALQKGDSMMRKLWGAFCRESLRHCHVIYDRLGVKIVDRGESFYTDLMDEVVDRLERTRAQRDDGFVAISQGALCLFMEGFTTREGEPLPLIVRKSDGGYNYATSDLATIVHRVEQLRARRIIYVVGLSQKQHFEMVFAAARRAGWVGDDVSLEHLGFGNMLNAQGKPFKTREGGAVKLKDVLDEAVARAQAVVEAQDKRPNEPLTREQMTHIAETVGIAAVKYFDLSHALTSDYRFDVDTMLSLDGNTAPYMLYAYARIRSIARKAGVDFDTLPRREPIMLEHPSEIALAKRLLRFPEVVESITLDLKPNQLTDYLFALARDFSRFYDKKLGVRVIDASPESVRASRLRLCDLTARTLKIGLSLLGIGTLEQM